MSCSSQEPKPGTYSWVCLHQLSSDPRILQLRHCSQSCCQLLCHLLLLPCQDAEAASIRTGGCGKLQHVQQAVSCSAPCCSRPRAQQIRLTHQSWSPSSSSMVACRGQPSDSASPACTLGARSCRPKTSMTRSYNPEFCATMRPWFRQQLVPITMIHLSCMRSYI